MLLIPTDFGGNAYNSQKVNIDGVNVSFRFLWNDRSGAWVCDFESVDGANYGVELHAGRQILLGFNHVLKGGDFVILKTERTSAEALGFDNLGSVYKLYFVTPEDVATLEKSGSL